MTNISRKDLYDQVWARPMRTVAKDFGISDRGLAKICEKSDIPRPPRGYWAKRDNGHIVKQQKLPKSAISATEIIVIDPAHRSFKGAPVTAKFEEPLPEITVPEKLSNPHPITHQCRTLLKNGRMDDYGRIHTNPQPPIKVGKTSLQRTLRILDTILKTSKKLGYETSFDQSAGDISVSVDGHEIHLSIEERGRRTELPRPNDADQWYYRRYEYDLTGELALKIGGRHLYGMRQSWKDTKTRSLESQLPKFIVYLPSVVEAIRLGKEKDAAREERWRLEAVRSQREKRRKTLLEQRCETIELEVENWNKAKQLREFLKSLQKSGTSDQKKRRLARWAWQYADHLDPMTDYRLSGLDAASENSSWPTIRYLD